MMVPIYILSKTAFHFPSNKIASAYSNDGTEGSSKENDGMAMQCHAYLAP